jgi:hypothetical protein
MAADKPRGGKDAVEKGKSLPMPRFKPQLSYRQPVGYLLNWLIYQNLTNNEPL